MAVFINNDYCAVKQYFSTEQTCCILTAVQSINCMKLYIK